MQNIKSHKKISTSIGFGVLILFLSLTVSVVKAQTIYTHVSNYTIYELMDELAGQQHIELNTAVKPYSRKLIAEKLQEAQEKGRLNERQKAEVAFFLKDYRKELEVGKYENKRWDLFYHSDSIFSITVNPILGIRTDVSNSAYHRWNGGEAFGRLGKRWAFYAIQLSKSLLKFSHMFSTNKSCFFQYRKNGFIHFGFYAMILRF